MAFVNINKLTGLSVVSGLGAVRFIGGGRMYSIPTSDSTYNYFPGDLVGFTGAGDANGLPNVAMTAAGASAVGVIQAIGTNAVGGPYINPNNLALIYAPLTKAVPYYAFVVDDPMALFEIQEVGTGTSLTATCVGANANILLDATATGTPLATQAFSRTGITDTAAPTTTSTLNLNIISFAQRIDNHFVVGTGGGFQKWWVRINNHYFSSGTTAA